MVERPQQREVRAVRDRALGAVVEAYNDAGIEMPAEIVVLDSTPQKREALLGSRSCREGSAGEGEDGTAAEA